MTKVQDEARLKRNFRDLVKAVAFEISYAEKDKRYGDGQRLRRYLRLIGITMVTSKEMVRMRGGDGLKTVIIDMDRRHGDVLIPLKHGNPY